MPVIATARGGVLKWILNIELSLRLFAAPCAFCIMETRQLDIRTNEIFFSIPCENSGAIWMSIKNTKIHLLYCSFTL